MTDTLPKDDAMKILDVLNVELAKASDARLDLREWQVSRREWQVSKWNPSSGYVCQITPVRRGRENRRRSGWWNESETPDAARTAAVTGVLKRAGFPGVSSVEELRLQLSLFSENDLKRMVKALTHLPRRFFEV